MNNDEARAILVDQRGAINSAINGLDRYVKEVVVEDNYSVTAGENLMSQVKAFATDAGADIRLWDGSKVLVVDEVI